MGWKEVNMSTITEQIKVLLPKGKLKDVNALVEQGIQDGLSAMEILNDGLLASMDILAKKWADGEAFIPEVLIGARCLNSAIAILEPELAKEKSTSKGTIIIGTVRGDLHDIGKNLCALMLKAKGFEMIDLGVDVGADKFVEAVKKYDSKFICLSALLTTSMVNFKEVIDALNAAGIREEVKVAVGGAPVTQAFADEIGADIFTEDAVSLANEIIKYI